MAITKDYLNTSDLSVLAAWMQTNLVPDYFASVTVENGSMACTDSDGNTLLTFITTRITAYKSASISVALTTTTTTFGYAYMCANGALITGSSGNSQIALLISKTNNGKIAIVFSFGTVAQIYRTNIKRVAWGDVQPDTTHAFTPIEANQTQLVPFVTDAALGDTSYTPNAFYIPFGQYYSIGIGAISIDGNVYLTSGYWAIRDT